MSVMDDVHVSVVIACFNAAQTLAAQLQALVDQRGAPAFEIVLVDDGSTDASIEVAARYRKACPALRVHELAHLGNVAAVRNEGVRQARGRLILFCDADDVVGPDWVACLSSALRSHDVVAGPLDVQHLNASWTVDASKLSQTHALQRAGFLPFAGGGNLGIRRQVFEALGGFDTELPALEDTDLCFAAQLRGHDLVFVPGAVVHVRLRRTYRGLYRQGHSWGLGTAALHRKYLEHGMPLPSRIRHLAGWLLVVPRLLTVHDRARLGRWCFAIGWRLGRLRGNVRYRLLLL
jgi:glycosyltransferase involved in cell wall biosynthesis